MARSREVPREERELAYAEACAQLDAVSARWLDARTVGQVPSALNAEMDAADREVRRTARKLVATIKRLNKNASGEEANV